jgi:hypothetical protein
MKYTGKLFGKVGKTYIPLILTSDEVDTMERDKARIDWLADPENAIGNVQLPVGAVTENIGSLRDAIDAAMSGNYEKNAPMVEPGYSENASAMAPPPQRLPSTKDASGG